MFKNQVFYLFGTKVFVTACVLSLTLALPLLAQPELPWKVVSSGGTDATSGGLRLRGTVGQTAATYSTAGILELNAGFWQNFGAAGGCCIGIRGDADGNGIDNDVEDLTYIIDNIFRGGPPPPCPQEAD